MSYYPLISIALLCVLSSVLTPLEDVYARSLSFDGRITDDAFDVVTHEPRDKSTRIRPIGRQPEISEDSPPYSGGDLQGVSFSFSDLSSISDPDTWPARANVIVTSKPASGGKPLRCSGALIDARNVLTAAHCIFPPGEDFVESVKVESFGGKSYGFANAILNTTFVGWTEHKMSGYDVAVITLNRPIGALTGWYGFGKGNCSDMKNQNWESFSFPGDGPLNDVLSHWSGKFDWCPKVNLVQTNNPAFDGMSGATAARPGHFIARGVLSHKHPVWPKGTRYVRLTNTMRNVIYDVVDSAHPDIPDLIPVGFTLSKDFISSPTPGNSHIHISDVQVFNESSSDWSGEFTLHVKRSNNENISASDDTIWSSTGTYDIQAMRSLMVSTIDIDVADFNEGDHFIGLWLEADDSNSGNNDGDDRLSNELAKLTIVDALADLELLTVEVSPGSYADFEQPEVTVSITNSGEIDIFGDWKTDLYISNSPSYWDGIGAIKVASGEGVGLTVGSVAQDTIAIPINGVPPGDYWVHVVASTTDDEVSEAGIGNGETNNQKSSYGHFTVQAHSDDFAPVPADLNLDYVALVSGNYDKSEEVPLTFSVSNISSTDADVWFAEFFAVNGQGTVVHLITGQDNSLQAGETFASTEHLPLQALSAGTWWIAMSVNTSNDENTGNNTGSTSGTFAVVNGLQFP